MSIYHTNLFKRSIFISVEEICECLKKVGPDILPAATSKRAVAEQIRKFDVQQSGVLEFDEFVKFLSRQSVYHTNPSKICSIQ